MAKGSVLRGVGVGVVGDGEAVIHRQHMQLGKEVDNLQVFNARIQNPECDIEVSRVFEGGNSCCEVILYGYSPAATHECGDAAEADFR